jgi:drug/metabolite transporter (DMT)-like permease
MSRGMKDVGQVTLQHWTTIFSALLNPWVAAGTVLLVCFLTTYMAALSWADLTFVLPATSVSYILVALLGQFAMPVLGSPAEKIDITRWAGIVLITIGLGFVAGGRAHTPHQEREEMAEQRVRR